MWTPQFLIASSRHCDILTDRSFVFGSPDAEIAKTGSVEVAMGRYRRRH
jgi:hypothetical protein